VTGKHIRARRFRSPVGLVATTTGVALLVGGTVGAVHLVSSPTSATALSPAATTPAVTPGASQSTTVSAPSPVRSSPEQSRSTGRASRAQSRTATPRPTASRPTVSKPKAPTSVVGTGSCEASFYDEPQATANGETFDPEALTAAHKTLAFDTRVRVTNPDNGRSVVVRINDRGPYVDGRCLDLSRAAFRSITSLDAGAIDVRYEILATSGG
jgi:rare lipoprotein A